MNDGHFKFSIITSTQLQSNYFYLYFYYMIYVTPSELKDKSKASATKTRIQKLFQTRVVAKYPKIFNSDETRTIELSADVLAYVVS